MPGMSYDFRPRTPMGFGGQRPRATQPFASGEEEQFFGMPAATQNLFGTLSALRQQNQAVAQRPAGRARPVADAGWMQQRGFNPNAGLGRMGPPLGGQMGGMQPQGPMPNVVQLGQQPTMEQLLGVDDAGTDAIGRRFAAMTFGTDEGSRNKYTYNADINQLAATPDLRNSLISRGLMTPEGRPIINRPVGASPGMAQMNMPFGGDPMMALFGQLFGGGQQAQSGTYPQGSPRELVMRKAQQDTAARRNRLGTGDPFDMLLRRNPMAYAAVTQAQGNAGLGQQKNQIDALGEFGKMFGAQQEFGAQNRATSAAVLGAIGPMVASGALTKEQGAALASQAMQDVFGGLFDGGGQAGGEPAPLNPVTREELTPFTSDPESVVNELKRRGFKGAALNKEMSKIYNSRYRSGQDPSGWQTMLGGQRVNAQGRVENSALGNLADWFLYDLTGLGGPMQAAMAEKMPLVRGKQPTAEEQAIINERRKRRYQ